MAAESSVWPKLKIATVEKETGQTDLIIVAARLPTTISLLQTVHYRGHLTTHQFHGNQPPSDFFMFTAQLFSVTYS